MQPGVAKAAFLATVEAGAGAGFQATVSWDTSFPKNLMGTSSANQTVNAWIVYLSGSQKDNGKIVMDDLPRFTAYYSDALPQGEIWKYVCK